MIARPKVSPDVKTDGFDPTRVLDPKRALVPAVIKVNEERVRRGFWPKIVRTASKIPFASDAVAVWFCARDPATPRAAKGMMLAALAYFVMPADAIPDVLAVVGFTDDAAVFAAMLALVGRYVKPRHKVEAQAFLDRQTQDGSEP
ncbi:YkvA family protein [Phenylobacterium sp.]|uniref:YkvA family protein n=1 Tax=Phenylobacterium sp. TaxID=1871053 RepID=UPI00273037B3|nr:YkvA family protein [Phenylobacterium sp.]MDP1872861.1 YkvA family protein [Phenylobacterium sp.]MDP3300308.1 YkvA family protein [Phenylobacterium sp.]MDP3490197.1 YkvA family protein [Phenylobacterium sp.]